MCVTLQELEAFQSSHAANHAADHIGPHHRVITCGARDSIEAEMAARKALEIAREATEPRIGALDRIVDAMEATKKAADAILHPINIHIATESWIAVAHPRDLDQIPGPMTGKMQKRYRGVLVFYGGPEVGLGNA